MISREYYNVHVAIVPTLIGYARYGVPEYRRRRLELLCELNRIDYNDHIQVVQVSYSIPEENNDIIKKGIWDEELGKRLYFDGDILPAEIFNSINENDDVDIEIVIRGDNDYVTGYARMHCVANQSGSRYSDIAPFEHAVDTVWQ